MKKKIVGVVCVWNRERDVVLYTNCLIPKRFMSESGQGIPAEKLAEFL